MYSLIDSHCHLDFADFDPDRESVLNRARAAGVQSIVVPGTRAASWPKTDAVCERHSNLYPCYGIHSYSAEEHDLEDVTRLAQWLDTHPCVAVGECGLDFRHGQADQARQLELFEAQLAVAQQLGKPVVVHSVRATEQVLRSVKERPGLQGMVHSYSGSYEQACQLVDQGFYLSFGGAATYPGASRLRETIAKLPLQALLLETDAPDQPDNEHHGERNEPAYVINVLNSIAELRTESAARIAEQTTANARLLFGI